jgi:hypothetical protein
MAARTMAVRRVRTLASAFSSSHDVTPARPNDTWGLVVTRTLGGARGVGPSRALAAVVRWDSHQSGIDSLDIGEANNRMVHVIIILTIVVPIVASASGSHGTLPRAARWLCDFFLGCVRVNG